MHNSIVQILKMLIWPLGAWNKLWKVNGVVGEGDVGCCWLVSCFEPPSTEDLRWPMSPALCDLNYEAIFGL